MSTTQTAYAFPLTHEVSVRTLVDMKTIKATNLRKTLYAMLDEVRRDRSPVEVVLGGKTAAVLMPAISTGSGRKPPIDLDAVATFCKKYQVKSLALFGSILRCDFGPASDVDVMVDLGERKIDVREMFQMVDHLEAMFGRHVDMLELANLALLDPIRRESISTTAKVIYEEALYDAVA